LRLAFALQTVLIGYGPEQVEPPMPEARKCSSCGTELPPDSPSALCARCAPGGSALSNETAPLKTIHLSPPLSEKPGDRIGRYKLLQEIGEGGFGMVYMAEQEEPVRRRVALKIIKLGMDTKQVIARFEAERQALALMDHPNIAKALDAGATESGRPYFVMELVKGERITEYCDKNNLSTRERLDLFVHICHAIQHAHQKGIIHRDIKPSNILVTMHDGVPVPKVIDFGIAKATEQRLTEKTLFTALEQMIGTPAYMSPEQAEMTGIDIDTRSDIYSLGVLLYELLTGKTPFDAKELLAHGVDEMRRTIREQEPRRPSTRLTTMLDGELTTTAKRRQTDAPKLVHLVRGDLDWIVMKCLEKVRGRRYETANGLAMDIQRHLAQEPVLARPPSTAYRLQKLVRRNKGAFAAVGAVVAALLIGLGLSTWLYLREKAERQVAQAAEKKAEAAEKEAQAARLSEAQLRSETEAVRKTAGDEAAQLHDAVKLLNFGRTNLDQAENYYRQTLQMQRKLIGNDSPDVMTTLMGLAQVLRQEDKEPEAVAAQREAVDLERKLPGTDDTALANSLGNLGLMLQSDGKSAEAEQAFRESLAQLRRLAATGPAGEHSSLGVVLHHLAMVLQDQKALPEARSLADEAALLYQRHPDWPANEKQHALQVLGNILAELHATDYGALASYESLARERLADDQKQWPNDPAQWKNSSESLAALLNTEHKYTEADQVLENLLPRSTMSQSQRAEALAARANIRAQNGRWREAAADYASLIELEPTDHLSYHLLAPLLVQSGDLEGYRRLCARLLARCGSTNDPFVAERMAKACLILPGSGVDLAAVGQLAETAVTVGKNDPSLPFFQFVKGFAEYRQDHFASAIEWEQKAFATPRVDFRDAEAWMVLAMAYDQLKRTDEAHNALAKGIEIINRHVPKPESGYIGRDWNDWLIAQALMKEAKELIEGLPTTAQK
jgi:eukaryotic-like serine/threonine-protein kinase